jgi:DnaK suppressor protein
MNNRVTGMNNSDLLHYKSLLLAKRDELSANGSPVASISTAGEARGDLLDLAASEANSNMHIRLKERDGELLRAIENALTRIRRERFGICEECGQPISKARLEAVPWARQCRDCKERPDSRG